MIFGTDGERGKTGDHGQQGPSGERGPQGERGPAGSSDPDEFEATVAAVVGRALADNRLRLTDRRLVVMFLFVTFAAGLWFWVDNRADERFRQQIIGTCVATNEGNMKVNELLATLRANALTNPARTPEDKARVAETYEGLKLPVVNCPPGE